MEYHNIHGGREECSSNESGWTMYIASPDHEYSYVEDEPDHANDKNEDIGDDSNGENNESDDSMISDASSGPSHQGFVYPGVEESHGFNESQRAEQKNNRKCTTGKKQRRQVEKKPSNQERKAAKEQPGSKVNSKFRKNK